MQHPPARGCNHFWHSEIPGYPLICLNLQNLIKVKRILSRNTFSNAPKVLIILDSLQVTSYGRVSSTTLSIYGFKYEYIPPPLGKKTILYSEVTLNRVKKIIITYSFGLSHFYNLFLLIMYFK